MNPASSKLSDKVTVLVFKDNYAARTFQVSLSWINRLGILLGIFLTSTLVSVYLAVKYYRMNLVSISNRGTEFTLANRSLAPLPIPVPAPPNSSESLTQKRATPLPTATASAPSPIANTSPAHPGIYQFSAFSESSVGPVPAITDLPFTIQAPQMTWKGTSLIIHFALQYIKDDQENQQGRIVILARSPESIRAYPNGILSLPGTPTLIRPERGEFFSVSRFREVKANFGPIAPKEVISAIEIFIFNSDGKILTYQSLTPPPRKKSVEEPPTEPLDES
jgi:hypothetical protein